MTFKTHNDTDINVAGTSLSAYLYTTFDKLVETFGEPTTADEYKVDWEWMIEFDDGSVATVYNWKNGPNYCGIDGLQSYEITKWHIGSKSMTPAWRVQDIIEEQNAEGTTDAMDKLSEAMNPVGGE